MSTSNATAALLEHSGLLVVEEEVGGCGLKLGAAMLRDGESASFQTLIFGHKGGGSGTVNLHN